MARDVEADWQPAASLDTLRRRARLLADIRAFMEERGILEVETPILSNAATSDPNLESLALKCVLPEKRRKLYLHTSPEFAMKRLLAARTGAIYQIARVFRDRERGRWHHPEFTMLEWYRPDFDMRQMMEEAGELLRKLGFAEPRYRSYAEVFADHVGVDPFTAPRTDLQAHAARLGFDGGAADRDCLLDFLFSRGVAPRLGENRPEFVYGFPVSQCALASIQPGKPPLALRFEVLIAGLEIANGFEELRDPQEQRLRWGADQAKRRQRRQPLRPLDERLLAALEHGLPACSGIAMGLDRLLMILTGATHIDEVLAFPIERA